MKEVFLPRIPSFQELKKEFMKILGKFLGGGLGEPFFQEELPQRNSVADQFPCLGIEAFVMGVTHGKSLAGQ